MELASNDRSIAAFTMLGHGVVHWFELAIPILLVVWLDAFDVSVAVIGLVVALGYAPFGLGALPAGVLVDRFGPKQPILWCLTGMSLSFAALAVAPSIYAVALCLLAWGIAASVYHPAGLALISTGVEDRGTVFAWHGIAGNLGIALGPFATATLLLFFEWQLVALALAVPGVVATAYGLSADFDSTAAVDDTPDDAGGSGRSSLVSDSKSLFASSFLLVFSIVTIVGLYYRGVLTYLPEILQGLPAMAGVALPAGIEELSLGDYFYVGLLVAGMAGQYVAGKLTRRMPVARGLVVVFGALAVLAVVFIPVSGLGLVAVLVYCAVLGFTLFAIEPFYQEAVAVYTPADSRGLSYGYTYLGMFGLGALNISFGGFLLEYLSLTAFFLSLSVIAVAGTAVAWRLITAPVGQAAPAAEADAASSDDD
ncbi:major facilitator superfamily transport protein [Natronomonas pharaonis DSM 2160]|uniref:Major facilitator superfamily transport protein n=1 Tax=Natronomonas pharaonis (strain ATCC 35678 / DSM 2160 / CIP 103997 / JCM 8858 / NBRC 14720 / NCIMB 2260 / Gabara) TaxID=348780 RepID=A0A1U7EXI6_NATPD|nr:MFS transporter [Natronomonas pharaonis]CAI49896.1 major facilitator superfamily transport protein [Natronomonas pharaonis DSM 2160]